MRRDGWIISVPPGGGGRPLGAWAARGGPDPNVREERPQWSSSCGDSFSSSQKKSGNTACEGLGYRWGSLEISPTQQKKGLLW